MAATVQEAVYRMRVEGEAQVAKATASLNTLAVTEEKVTRATASTQSAFDRMLQRLDRRVAAEAQLQRTLAQVQRYQEAGVGTTEQHNRAIDLANRRYTEQIATLQKAKVANDNMTHSVGLARHELINMGRQAQDIGVSLLGGQSPFTVLAQQGTQVADIIATSNSSLRDMGRQVLGFFTPARLAIGGLAIAATAAAVAYSQFAASQRELSASLTGLGRGSGATADQLNAIAQAANPSNISRATSRELLGGFAGTGRIGAGMAGQLAGISRAFGLQTGVDTATAGAELAKAFSDPAKGAAMLDEKLGILDARTKEYIRSALAMGDRTAAQKALFDAMGPALIDAEKRVTSLGKAWNYVWNMASNAADSIGRAVQGPGLDEQIDRARKALAQAPNPGQFPPNSAAARMALSQQDTLRNNLATLEAERAFRDMRVRMDEEERVRRERSSAATDIVRRYAPEAVQRREMEEFRDSLTKALADPAITRKLGESAGTAREALSRLSSQLDVMVSPAEKLAQDNKLAVDAINARTLAERIDVAQRRAALEVLRESGDVAKAAAAAEGERNRQIAEANRQARDMLRDARDQASLIGLNPMQRLIREEEIARRKIVEEFGGGAGNNGLTARLTAANDNFLSKMEAIFARYFGGATGPAGGGAALGSFVSADGMVRGGGAPAGLAGDFQSKVAALIRAVEDAGGSLRVTSGFRTFEQQAALFQKYGPGKAAAPGHSQHERGTAIDVVTSDPSALREAAARLGLRVIPSNGGAFHVDMGRGGGGLNPAAGLGDRLAANRIQFGSQMGELSGGVFREANLELERMQRANDALATSFGRSAYETDAINNALRLRNDLIRNGVTINADMERSIGGIAEAMAREQQRTRELAQAHEDLKRVIGDFKSATASAFSTFIGGLLRGESAAKSATKAMEQFATQITNMAANMFVNQMFRGVENGGFGGFFGGLFKGLFGGGGLGGAAAVNPFGGGFYANGAAFAGGNVVPFAQGGVVHRPTLFPMARGMGLMGEAGPEAVMPLRRDAQGRLGVHGGGASVTVNLIGVAQPLKEQREEDDGRGGRRIDLVFDEMSAANINSGPKTRQAMSARGARMQRQRFL